MYIFLYFVGLLTTISIIWRLGSRRHALPCPVWLSWLVELDNPFTKTNRAAVIVEHLDIQAGMSILDVGCGPGRLTIPLAKQVTSGGNVVAVDIQNGMLRRAEKKALAANLSNIQYVQANIGEGQLWHSQFDRALMVTVLGEIPNRETALKEIFEALKSGGILSITEIIFDPHFQSRRAIERLAASTGFREKAFFGNAIAYTLHLEKPHTVVPNS